MAKSKLKEPKGIKIKGEYAIWPNGTKTHMRFIREGVQKRRPLPPGFYAEAKRLDLPNLNLLAAKAESLNLKEEKLK
ncbi:MAG: hypothetical protein ACW99F_03370 [Candidatus Hodarchaeales archaeon]